MSTGPPTHRTDEDVGGAKFNFYPQLAKTLSILRECNVTNGNTLRTPPSEKYHYGIVRCRSTFSETIGTRAAISQDGRGARCDTKSCRVWTTIPRLHRASASRRMVIITLQWTCNEEGRNGYCARPKENHVESQRRTRLGCNVISCTALVYAVPNIIVCIVVPTTR